MISCRGEGFETRPKAFNKKLHYERATSVEAWLVAGKLGAPSRKVAWWVLATSATLALAPHHSNSLSLFSTISPLCPETGKEMVGDSSSVYGAQVV